MGMDVYGKSPTSETGTYFRRNVWGWRPLAELVCEICPKETQKCEYWGSNDGDGLDGRGAIALADALQAKVGSGAVAAFILARNNHLACLPHEECSLCGGTGVRTDETGKKMAMELRIIKDDAIWEGKRHLRAGQSDKRVVRMSKPLEFATPATANEWAKGHSARCLYRAAYNQSPRAFPHDIYEIDGRRLFEIRDGPIVRLFELEGGRLTKCPTA